jgi:hypothetical protein
MIYQVTSKYSKDTEHPVIETSADIPVLKKTMTPGKADGDSESELASKQERNSLN